MIFSTSRWCITFIYGVKGKRSMDIKKKVLIDLKFTYKSIKKSWKLLILNSGLDFLFLVAISIATTLVQLRMFDHLYQLLQMIGEQTGGLINSLTDPTMPTLVGISNNPTFQFHFNQVLIYLAILFIVLFILWVLFQGTIWWLTHKIVGHKLKFSSYMNSFFLESVLFFAIFGVSIFFFLQSYVNTGLSLSSVISLFQLRIGYVIFLLLVLYFASMSYSSKGYDAKQNLKDAFVKGTKGFLGMLPALVIILAFFFLFLPFIWNAIFLYLGKWVSFIFGLLVFIPSFTIARVLFVRTMSKLPKDL